MKTYTVLINLKSPKRQMVMLPESFTIWGFIFGVIWLFFSKQWLWGIVFLILNIIVSQMGQSDLITTTTAAIITTGLHLAVGFYGHDLIRKGFEKSGYLLDDVIVASSNQEAELKFLCRYS